MNKRLLVLLIATTLVGCSNSKSVVVETTTTEEETTTERETTTTIEETTTTEIETTTVEETTTTTQPETTTEEETVEETSPIVETFEPETVYVEQSPVPVAIDNLITEDLIFNLFQEYGATNVPEWKLEVVIGCVYNYYTQTITRHPDWKGLPIYVVINTEHRYMWIDETYRKHCGDWWTWESYVAKREVILKLIHKVWNEGTWHNYTMWQSYSPLIKNPSGWTVWTAVEGFGYVGR